MNLKVTLPPDIFHPGINAKCVNSFIRHSYTFDTPEVSHWVDLQSFCHHYDDNYVRTHLRKAIAYGITFRKVTEKVEKETCYNIISHNRSSRSRPMYMDFDEVLQMESIVQVDWFLAEVEGEAVASGIYYCNDRNISLGIFWGDTDKGRKMSAMNLLVDRLWDYYKKLGFKYVDLGISTEMGEPNSGLVRFKEGYEAEASPRFSFSWSPS